MKVFGYEVPTAVWWILGGLAFAALILLIVSMATYSGFFGIPSVWTKRYPMTDEDKRTFASRYDNNAIGRMALSYLTNVLKFEPYESARINEITMIEVDSYNIRFFVYNAAVQTQPSSKINTYTVDFGIETFQGRARPFVHNMRKVD